MPHFIVRLCLPLLRWRGVGHIWVLLLSALLACAPAHAQRVALIIGNANYASEARLRNPVNDARLIERTLKAAPLAFNSVTYIDNANRAQLLAGLASFKRHSQGAEVALVYYSGHGMMNGKRQNYLLPVDMPKISANASLDVDTALDIHGVNEDKVLETLEGAKIQLAILDACRDNGFGGQKSGTKGLSRRADQSRNRLVAYATEEGRTAEDGSGANSTYATSLAKHLVRIDWPLLKVFDEVASDVERNTRGTQLPTRSGNLRTDVYLLASLVPVPSGQAMQADPDQEAWEMAKKRDTAASYQAYLSAYPNGRYVQSARIAKEGHADSQSTNTGNATRISSNAASEGRSAQAYPIFIAQFAGDIAQGTEVADIVRADLVRGGNFKVVSQTVAQDGLMDVNTRVDISKWRTREVEAVVVGNVNQLPDSRLEVSFRLWSITSGKEMGGQSFRVAQHDVRLAAHRIADQLHEKLLGKPGTHATRIAFVQEKPAGRFQLLVADSDEFNEQPALTSATPIILPTWSADQTRLAYVSFEADKGKGPHIYVHEVRTGKRVLKGLAADISVCDDEISGQDHKTRPWLRASATEPNTGSCLDGLRAFLR